MVKKQADQHAKSELRKRRQFEGVGLAPPRSGLLSAPSDILRVPPGSQKTSPAQSTLAHLHEIESALALPAARELGFGNVGAKCDLMTNK